MKRIKTFFLGLAVLLINLHAITPHTHDKSDLGNESAVISIERERSTDIIDLLQFVFHQDLGQDHLENFQNQDFDIKIIPTYHFESFVINFKPIATGKIEHHETYLVSHHEVPVVRLHQLRGPPELG